MEGNTRNRRKTSTISNSILHEFSSVIITETPEDDLGPEEKFTFREALPQIMASCSATSFHIIVGVTFAATATLLPQIMSAESGFAASTTETAWVASVFVLTVPIASFGAAYFTDRIGRLNTVKLSVIPAVASCAMIALADNVYMVIAGRCLMGVATAFGSNPAVVYITESTSSDYRGALVSAGPTLSSLGMMLGYLLGAILPWRLVSWINIGFCVIPLVLITLLRIPESPAWLLSWDREGDARAALEWMCKWKSVSARERFIEERMTALKKVSKQRGQQDGPSITQKLSGLLKPTGYRPLIILFMIFTFQQYSGVYITTFYAVQFFEGARASMNAFYAAILIGLLRFLGSLLTTILLKHCKRRSMFFVSTIGMSVMMAISGYFTMKVIETNESSMVPVYCILAYVGFSMIGLLSLPWTMAAEVFPNEIRAVGHGLLIGLAHIVMFISVQTFFSMVEFFGGFHGIQWFFAVISILSFIFIYYFLPETHDTSLAEIEEYFLNNKIYPNRKKPKKTTEENKKLGPMKEMKPVNVQTLEALEEYDTLLHREEGKPATILPMDEKFYVGHTDTRKLQYIDKSLDNIITSAEDVRIWSNPAVTPQTPEGAVDHQNDAADDNVTEGTAEGDVSEGTNIPE